MSSNPPLINPSEQTVFSYDKTRLLFLDGDKGSVACRVHGALTANTLPKLSEHQRIELATRSLLRMNNLSAVRGGTRGENMIGPGDYYGNIEAPDQYLHRIELTNGVPQLYQQVADSELPKDIELRPFKEEYLTAVSATWTSGKDHRIKDKKKHYDTEKGPAFGNSLFPNPGLLEIDDAQDIALKPFNPVGVDLSSFKARLVANDKPFQITRQKLQSTDEYRAVSYLYEPGYTQNQIEHGGGLFLEKHDFSQTMTPLDEHAQGFVTLARWNDDEKTRLEIIAIEIPLGYTLIIEKDCLHGDATLDGAFMMCMTSNHKTMQTADTVFLKHPGTKQNTAFTLDSPKPLLRPMAKAPAPHVIHNDATDQEMTQFLQDTQHKNFMFNPFSKGYWRRGMGLMQNHSISLQILGAVTAVAGAAALIIAFGSLNALSGGIAGLCLAGAGVALALTGFGLFSAASSTLDKPKDAYHLPPQPLFAMPMP